MVISNCVINLSTDKPAVLTEIAAALSRSEYEAGLEAAGVEQITVQFTHQVADGMHGAIVKAVKTSHPAAKGSPAIHPRASAGCC